MLFKNKFNIVVQHRTLVSTYYVCLTDSKENRYNLQHAMD